jgi:DUF2075 family protein
MLVYESTKGNFTDDVLSGDIAEKIKEKLHEHGIEDNNPREFNAWNNSMRFMKDVLEDNAIPQDCEVSIEYEIPLTSKRVDFIVTGADALGEDNVIIIELKQWTTAEKVDDVECHTVKAFVASAERNVAHPCYQAYSYKVHIMSYSEVAANPNIHLIPCAFCHNFQEESRSVLEDPIYKEWIDEAPLFLKHDLLKLREFIRQRICAKSKDPKLLSTIDHGQIRPAKALQDCLASMLNGNKEFQLMDDQITIYDRCIKAFTLSMDDEEKRVLIVEGGPGTGKSVLAVNLLCDFIKQNKNSAYVTKNSAPRKVYLSELSHNSVKDKLKIDDLFRSPFGLGSLSKDTYDCLVIDEAHRLVMKQYGDWKGTNQIKECINAAKVSIFFIDDTQRITVKDIGSKANIIKYAKEMGIKPENIWSDDDMILHSEFRCNGSDGYMAFLDNLLGIRKTANTTLDLEGFDFRVYDDPCQMREDLRLKNQLNNKARMIAGYCYDWNVKNHRGDWDVVLDNGRFQAKWNLEKDGSLWAIRPNSFDDIGCIHTSQGLEFDYVGVIIGKDLRYIDGTVITDRNQISRDDNSSGIRTTHDEALADQLIRNTYKVLLSRGQKGCYVYCEDREISNYIASRLKK